LVIQSKKTIFANKYISNMKRIVFIAIALLLQLTVFAQTAEECYNKGKSFNDQKDYIKAMEWYLKAANQGHAQAQVMIGWYYKHGYAVEANTDKALDWYLKAAKQGYAQAQYLAGAVYNDRKDYTNAAKWYQKAADQDHASAQINLGALYNNGQGVAQDFKKAVEWYQKSAYQGNVYAQNNLGWMYEKGRGVPQDFVKAAEWYERAANKDFALAKKNLARIQEFLPKDYQKQVQQVPSEQNKSIAQNNVSKVQTQTKKTEEPAKTSSNTPRQQTVSTMIVMPDVDKDIPLTTVKNPNLLAVIIGNENYRKLPDVPYAENDARMFKEYCEKTLGVTEEHIKYLPNAGLVDIYDARDWLKTGAESYGNDASVIFYYAGHGLPNRETGLPYILPVEVDGSNLKLAVSLQELYDEFGKLPARSVTVFLDACFTGVDRDNNVVASREGERLAFKMSPKIPTPTGKTVIFSATENNQTAHPFKDRNHGFFTYFLLKKLQESKGDATLGEIADYVTKNVKRAVFDKIQTSQTPSVKPSGNFANDWRQMKLK
jgi:TPR repeat protein